MSPVVRESMQKFAAECRDEWSALAQMKILVTGGTGFYGSWLLASFIALREAGVPTEMIILSRSPDKFLAKNARLRAVPGLHFQAGDVIDAIIPGGITHVFHFATTPTDRAGSTSDATPEAAAAAETNMRRTIIDGTKRMLEESVRVRAKRFLLASSGAVYGVGKTDRPDENTLELPVDAHPEENLTVYGKAKREAEELCRAASNRGAIETIIARGFSFSGPLFPIEASYALSNFMKTMLSGENLDVKSPETVRSYLDGRDLVRALWKLMLRGRNGDAYNVGSEESVTMLQLAKEVQALAKNMGRPVPEIQARSHDLAAGRKADIYRPTIEKLKRELAWRPQITLRESLKAFADSVCD